MVIKHTMNGNIQALIKKASLVIQSNFHEHIMEPFGKIDLLQFLISFISLIS